MAEKQDIKTFYESTKPTSKNIDILFNDIYHNNVANTKQGFVESSNKAFAMLAHLKAYTFDIDETYRIKNMYSSHDFIAIQGILTKLQIAKKSPAKVNLDINPSAVPMIQRYMKIFEAYEKQNGLTNPYVKKLGKEPGDN